MRQDHNRPILKTEAEIEKMRVANKIVARALRLVEEMVRPGISTAEIDGAVENLIRGAGAVPLFKNYPSGNSEVPDFPASICASVDYEVVHGIPKKTRILQAGQIISVDVGAKIDGYCGDAAGTFPVGEVGKKARKLLTVTEECLRSAIAAIRPNGRLYDISGAVQRCAEKNGFSVVRQFVGHGIGAEMHEPPQVPNYISRKENYDMPLGAGMVLAIEPMVNIGGYEVLTAKDGWTVFTRDRSLSAHFEHTVAITANGAEVLSV
ncbi:type I methionyl aminopeptidase [Planctomycetales bacterium]|nr:type I methionyl aminopeptidase [Planctomycetales bacterium]GHS99780.1 type I methionyl aminopeptidase [Planctomycetales bacterium]GHT07227.1 type I methionyl aminopeptidase [Planctomycetales bacterium]